MPLKTLCGMFDEPVKTPKKNFIRENIKSIKQLQDLLHEAQRTKENSKSSIDHFQNCRKSRERMCSIDRLKTSSKQDVSMTRKENYLSSTRIQDINRKPVTKTIGKMQSMTKLKGYKIKKSDTSDYKPQYSDRSVQTDSDLGCGDVEISQIKENKQTVNSVNVSKGKNPNKIMEDGFYSIKADIEAKPKEPVILLPQCPPGHVMLPEAERVETLRTLKQSYEKQIHQLNGLSLTCDTLRIKRKRREIEEDLKRIDEAIKIFDRPKVYVKE